MLSMIKLDCIPVLKALSEITRVRIVRLLMKEPLDVNEISQRLKVSQYNVSKHLRILREARLLEMERQGKKHLYAVPSNLRSQLTANKNVLELECCSFHLDKFSK